MSTVATTITSRARRLLNDVVASPNAPDWSPADLLLWYNDAVITIMALRPDTRLDATGAAITYAEATAETDTRLLEDQWRPAEADYICSRAFEQDAGDRRDTDRAAHHWDNFSRYINMS